MTGQNLERNVVGKQWLSDLGKVKNMVGGVKQSLVPLLRLRIPYSFWVVGVVGLVMVVGMYFDDGVEKAKKEILKSPALAEGYLKLSAMAAGYGDFKVARDILRSGSVIVGADESSSKVLGEASEVIEVVDPVKKLEDEAEAWKKMVERQPSYLPGYLRLAVLSWKLRRDVEAREYLEWAEQIDPNNEEVSKVKRVVLEKGVK